MSERMILEFYSTSAPNVPVATVLTFHGGEDPKSAALTIVDFISRISSLADSRLSDAGVMAARFITWMAALSTGSGELNFSDVTLIHHAGLYTCQLVRIYAGGERPYVQMVEDQYSTTDELSSANDLLGLYGLLRHS